MLFVELVKKSSVVKLCNRLSDTEVLLHHQNVHVQISPDQLRRSHIRSTAVATGSQSTVEVAHVSES